MNATRTAQQTYLRTLICIGAAMVLATLILRFGKALFLAPLNLTNENVVAAWFSGMLLLLGSLHAADGFFRLRKHNLKAALAWWVIASMLLFLSADEIGSLHERMKDLMRMGPWLSFLPFFIVLLGGCVWSFVQLWVTPSERRFVPGLVVGFGILVSVGGQEFLEHAFRWPWYLSPFRSAFEEGSELTGMLILIYTMLPNSAGLFAGVRPAQDPAFSSVPMMRWFFVISAAAIAWPLATLSSILGGQAEIGHPSDWLSCALFALGAALIAARWYQTREAASDGSKFPTTAVALMAVASAVCVQIDPIGDDTIFPFSQTLQLLGVEWNARLVLLGLCGLGVAEALRARGSESRTAAILMAIAGLVTVIFAAYAPSESALRWGYFITTAVGVLNLGALSHGLAASDREHARSMVPSTH